MPTLRLQVMPMLGDMRPGERLDSLRGCHALFERSIVKAIDSPPDMDAKIGAAVRELLLADRHAALRGKVTFIVQLEFLE